MAFAPYKQRWLLVVAVAAVSILLLLFNSTSRGWVLPENVPELKKETSPYTPTSSTSDIVAQTTSAKKSDSTWASLPQHFPVHSITTLPPGKPGKVFTIQHTFADGQTSKIKNLQQRRRDAVKEVFQHAWSGYKTYAWLKDEVAPISGGSRNSFGGLAATLVDALDSLWIMGLQEDFEEAVRAVAQIDFGRSEETVVNVFEYTIRYLGGLLGAFEISERKHPVLLDKAIEVGEMLYAAFDTPNRMPVTRWDWKSSVEGQAMQASDGQLVAELASLSLEFTTLSRLSKDDKYYDAIQRITDELQKAQNHTKLPGMWPVVVDARTPSFSGDNTFTLGAMSDSLYEYLPKVRVHSVIHSPQTNPITAAPTIKWCHLSIPRDVRRITWSHKNPPTISAYDQAK
jgi:mannosyl-oligosaccharide alpha-1,2-mannosidase